MNGSGNPQSNPNNTNSASGGLTPNVQLAFTDDLTGSTFSILAATNFSLPIENWTVIGQPLQIAPGTFQFTDLQSTNYPQRFYRVTSP